MKDYTYTKACKLIDKALELEPVEGLNRLVSALVGIADRHYAHEQRPCRMEAECLLYGRCPADPVCNE